MEKKLSRRKVINNVLAATGAVLATKVTAGGLLNNCGITPPQTEGPFYPISFKLDKDNDLTYLKSKNVKAKGEIVIIKGQVQDELCSPIRGAIIEIWQACHTGKYNHPSDPNPATLDPNFQYYGRAISDANGNYVFKTIIPGEYQATQTWIRPPHIHVKVQLRGYKELTTQMYFKGNKFNSSDRILNELTPEERKRVVIPFIKSFRGDNTGIFNISLPSF